MIIEEHDFKLESTSDFGRFWDLYLPKIINKGKDNERTEMTLDGYGLTLPTALTRVARFRMGVNDKSVYTLKEYLNEYIKQLKSLESLCTEDRCKIYRVYEEKDEQ